MENSTPSGGQTLYVRIQEDILSKIKNGIYAIGDKLPTETQLVKEYGVSRITVSKAMTELKEMGILERYPNRGTFVAKPIEMTSDHDSTPTAIEKKENSRLFEKAEMQKVALILPNILDQFALSLISGIEAAFPSDQFILSIVISHDNVGEIHALSMLLDQKTDGIILFPVDQEYYNDQILAMKLNHFPFVLIDRLFPGIDTSYVISDNYSSARLAIKYLFDLAHRSIAFFSIGNVKTFTVRERVAGCRYEVANTQWVEDSSFILMEDVDTTIDKAIYAKTLRNLIEKKGVTAFIASEISCATYLYSTLCEMGLCIPEDVSILSFDDPSSPEFSFFTHINQDEKQIGYRAGSILRDMIADTTKESHVVRHVVIPKLVVSKSTAPLKNIANEK